MPRKSVRVTVSLMHSGFKHPIFKPGQIRQLDVKLLKPRVVDDLLRTSLIGQTNDEH